MTLAEGFLLLIRWLHNVAAVAWVGGSLLHVLVLRPVLRAYPNSSPIAQAFTVHFLSLVDACVFILLATGTILLFDRLTPGKLGMAYIVIVVLKIAAALWMFLMAYRLRRRLQKRHSSDWAHEPVGLGAKLLNPFVRIRNGFSSAGGVTFVGVGILLLADVLRWLVEQQLQM